MIESESAQPAPRWGRKTRLRGLRILADSAMKWTPQNTMMSASVREASTDSPRESPVTSARSWIGGIW